MFGVVTHFMLWKQNRWKHVWQVVCVFKNFGNNPYVSPNKVETTFCVFKFYENIFTILIPSSNLKFTIHSKSDHHIFLIKLWQSISFLHYWACRAPSPTSSIFPKNEISFFISIIFYPLSSDPTYYLRKSEFWSHTLFHRHNVVDIVPLLLRI